MSALMIGEQVIVPRIWRERLCVVTYVYSEDEVIRKQLQGLPPTDAAVKVTRSDGELGIMSFPVRSADCVRKEGNVYRPVRWHR